MLQPSAITETENQIKRIEKKDEVENAIIELVGDLATYQPGKNLVILEGGGNIEFDKRMIEMLFPELYNKVNVLPVGNKKNVIELHSTLEKARKSGALAFKVFSIVDRDTDEAVPRAISSTMSWEVYHIENYLLEPQYILKVLTDLQKTTAVLKTESDVVRLLHECAQALLTELTRAELEREVNQKLVSLINTKIDRKKQRLAPLLRDTVVASTKKISELADKVLTLSYLEERENTIRARRTKELQENEWLNTFPGREILRLFVGKHGKGTSYEDFRNLMLARMKSDGFQPKNMKTLIDKILNET